MEVIEKIKSQLNEFWQKTDKSNKIKLGVASLLIITSISLMIYFVTKPNYEVLYANLTLEDAGVITKKLNEMGIDWTTGQSGTTILVPAEIKNKVKYELAAEGLPKDGYSFIDAFNDSSWTMTDYDKKQRLKYALESELAKNVTDINGIESANVYIYMPDDSGFVLSDNSGQAKASVFIKLSGLNRLSSEKVNAIKNLVSGAVRGMKPEDVTITDDLGKSYNDENNDYFGEYNLTEQLDIQQALQSKIDDSISKFLENIFGYGNVAVRSSVQINFDSELTNIREFSPPVEGSEEGLIRSMETIEEHMVNGPENGGVPGVDSNTGDIPDYGQGDDNNSKYDSAQKTINFELNEINKQIRKAPGQIESVTVAILINENSLKESQLTEEKKKEIKELIYAATGIETKQVEVSAAEFNTEIKNEDMFREPSERNMDNQWLMIGLLAIGFVLVGTLGYMVYRRNKDRKKDVSEMLDEAMNQEPIPEIDIEGKGNSEMVAQINRFVDKKPEEVAQLLKNWLNEE
ncbi:flagellar basal-body MS-ring/collar protein FliF [Caldisalinibacter kiritimatiensis]|uniref:Flagellar M-ring protein n=1 Tax=Caldisalinibacter kiritimatiensis TaxID=1304284 RepID=R1CAF9_9FIRM|nr:flagellar basal-body MS-ring/collar protein FliF [Caldisalinibacter kiritimatiensis]EOC99309.1 Flagellar M-ring protein FliF [Caldisalinibacter kiritimatiensis]